MSTTNNRLSAAKRDGYFKITSLHRDDLEELGFDTRNIDDDQMRCLAAKMADNYLECCFWHDLEVFAADFEIPSRKRD